jgi:hypothetical protein
MNREIELVRRRLSENRADAARWTVAARNAKREFRNADTARESRQFRLDLAEQCRAAARCNLEYLRRAKRAEQNADVSRETGDPTRAALKHAFDFLSSLDAYDDVVRAMARALPDRALNREACEVMRELGLILEGRDVFK